MPAWGATWMFVWIILVFFEQWRGGHQSPLLLPTRWWIWQRRLSRPPNQRYWNGQSAQPPLPPPAQVSCRWVEGQDPSCELTSVKTPHGRYPNQKLDSLKHTQWTECSQSNLQSTKRKRTLNILIFHGLEYYPTDPAMFKGSPCYKIGCNLMPAFRWPV